MPEYPEKTQSMPKELPQWQKLSNAAYHKSPEVSKSHLDEAHKSGRHYWARYLDPQRIAPKPTPAMELGSAFHAMVLEPDVYEKEFVVAPKIDKRTTAGKAEWKEWQANAKGKTLLTDETVDLLRLMTESVMSHPAARAILHLDGVAEQTFTWKDATTEQECKCRPDWLVDGMIVDLKTTLDASPEGFAKSTSNFRYHVQSNWYLRGVPDAKQFVFIAVEKTPPFAVAVYVASPEMVAAGGRAADQDLARIAEWKREQKWPSYSNQIETLNLPRWNND